MAAMYRFPSWNRGSSLATRGSFARVWVPLSPPGRTIMLKAVASMADVLDVELTPVPLPNVDLPPLTTAITRLAEDVVRTIAQDMVPYLLTQQVDESLKKLVPRLVQTAVSEEKVLIKETTQETTREALPDLLRPLVEQFAKEIFDMKDTVQETARKAMPDLLKPIVEQLDKEIIEKAMPNLLKPIVEQLGKDIIEKVVRDVVGAKAEAEVKKEIARLTAEA